MYTFIIAFSAGCGNGKFLFEVLCGVRTGCPLSSILFLLCVNPFIDIILLISDGPRLSVTRVCADDFGSTLRRLEVLKIQVTVFKLAARLAGLVLKPCKCVLIITVVKLTPALKSAIKVWLGDFVPEFKDFLIQESGKFLGWYIGIDATRISFRAPVKKFSHRVQEIVAGAAPASASLLRYNQRSVTVLSYVAQFADPPKDLGLAALAQRSVHSILRMPPNSMSRQLAHSIGPFCIVEPIPIISYCAAIRFRFASSIAEQLEALKTDIIDMLGDELPLVCLNGSLPLGNVNDPCIAQCLLNPLKFTGHLSFAKLIASRKAEHSWILTFPLTPPPPHHSGIQGAILAALKPFEQCSLAPSLKNKADVTLGEEFSGSFIVSPFWWNLLSDCIEKSPFMSVCVG